MKKSQIVGISLVLGIQLLLFSAPKAFAEPEKWKSKMNELYSVISDLLFNITSDERYHSPKNFSKIESETKRLSALAHDISSKKITSPDQDPSIDIFSGLFSKEAERAYFEMKRGHRSYARSVLRSITGYCFACHTRSGSGPSFSELPMSKELSSLSKYEKAEFFAATRQFDRALDDFEAIVADPTAAQMQLLQWEGSARYALAIAVRVKKDPDRALRIVERVIATPRAPYFLKEHAGQWRDSLLAWKKEEPREIKTEEGLYAEAMRLISLANSMQSYPADRKADVVYLRASAVIHDLMSTAPQGPHMGEAFLLAGVCYEALHDLSIWELHDLYYEACIRKVPHSNAALLCYHRLEESTFAGFSGSGGMNLPSDVQAKLNELEELAKTQVAAPK